MAKPKRARRALQSGYQPCGCRDCFEIAIGLPGAFCHECVTAGCELDSECCAPNAYGCGESSETFQRLNEQPGRNRV